MSVRASSRRNGCDEGTGSQTRCKNAIGLTTICHSGFDAARTTEAVLPRRFALAA
jgi:hypothetical protein